MRRLHRWLATLFAVFLLWISVTGIDSHVAEIIANGGLSEPAERAPGAPPADQSERRAEGGNFLIPEARAHEPESEPDAAPLAPAQKARVHSEPISGQAPIPAASAAPADFACPADMTCRPKAKPTGARAWVGWFHRIHSGNEFGPVGTIISLLSGLALFFFALSGLWMYIQMYRGRMVRVESGGSVRGGRWFW